MAEHHEAFLRLSPAYTACTVDSLRVRWGPLLQSFHRRGAFAMGSLPRVHGFPGLRLLCPIRLFLRALAFRWGLPCLRPTRLALPQKSPVVAMSDSNKMAEVARSSWPPPRSV